MTAVRVHNIGSVTTLIGDTGIDVTWNPIFTVFLCVAAVGKFVIGTCVGP